MTMRAEPATDVTAEDYLRWVRFALRDLPWSIRRELISELRGHLEELPPGTDLTARLGAPESYAADLRSAAGLERRRGPIAFLRARRPRNLILTVVVLTATGLAIGAVEWIDSYQPLAFYFGEEPPLGVVEAPAGGSESVVFHQGRPFRLGIDITNNGRFTVRILGAGYGPQRTPFSARLVMSGPMASSGFPGPFRRFHAFDMKPGEVRVLELEGVYANCREWDGQSGAETLSAFPVRYRFLWRTATADIQLPEELAIVFPKGFRCR
jgi:hypothetical protein